VSVFDEDEFEGVHELRARQELKQAKRAARDMKLNSTSQPPKMHYNPVLEISLASVAFFYVLIVFSGMGLNTKKASTYALSALPVLEEQYAHVGNDSGPLERESLSSFYLYAHGRRNVFGLRILLDLVHRQDILTLLTGPLFGRTRDVAVSEFVLESAAPFTIFIGKRGEYGRASADRPELKDLNEWKEAGLREGGFRVYTDNVPAARAFLAGGTARRISECKTLLAFFSTNRSGLFAGRPCVAGSRAVFGKSEEDVKDGLETVHELVDRVAEMRLEGEAKKIAGEAARAERAEKERKEREKREEKEREEKEKKAAERYKEMSLEERRKFEEKEEKKKMKKMSGRQIIRM